MNSKRATIGIPFNYDENWIGGTYYIKNLVSSLNLLPAAEQPDIWILSHSEDSFDFIRDNTNYPRLQWIAPVQIAGINEAIGRREKLKRLLTPWFMKKEVVFDVIFPSPIDRFSHQTACWIPDFQDKHLPDFFTDTELEAREKEHRSYFENYKHLVFSSHAAKNDFLHFYPEAEVSCHVVHFAVSDDVLASRDIEYVRDKYNLPERYFYCPNQFWIHKNHKLAIDAISHLKQQGIEAHIVFSGKEHDSRAPDHADNLKDLVIQQQLENNVQFLGFLPRDDQMAIFKGATCIVQPSLFEGWSTVIEDAKSLSQYILAADIPANVEQTNTNIEFFNPQDFIQLANLMEPYVTTPPKCETIDYDKYRKEFAADFILLVTSIIKRNTRT